MYRILVVDDEKIERTGIKSLLEKYNYPFEVYEAKNGKEAIQVLEKTEIHILITDIRMPIMDGISLIGWIREQNYEIRIVIYSAYGEFEYAQKAIQLSVENYILKPLNIKQFKECVDSVLESLERYKKDKQIMEHLIFENQRFTEQKILKELISNIRGNVFSPEAQQFYDEKFEKQYITLMLLETKEPIFDQFEKETIDLCITNFKENVYHLNISEYKELLFLVTTIMPSEKSLSELGEDIMNRVSNTYQIEIFVLLGMPLQKIDHIPTVYSRLERLEEYRFYVKSSAVLIDKGQYITSNRVDDAIDGVLNCICEDIKYKEYKKAIEDIQVLGNTIEAENKVSNIFVRQIFTEIIRKIAKASRCFSDEETLDMIKYILSAKNVFDIREYVLEKLIMLEKKKGLETKGEGNTDKLVSDVIGIIRKEYGNQDISLEYLASKVYLSPNYLSTIFKNKKGETLNSFLVNYRIERAKDLILTTNIKIGSIAEMVGFSSSGYFVTVFRNVVGVAPVKFRELNG